MKIMKEIDFFWVHLMGSFQTYVSGLPLLTERVAHKIGATSNDCFLLRAYLSFMGNLDGDELSVTVDVRLVDGFLLIESDVMGEGGCVIVSGPVLEYQFTDWSEAQQRCHQYLEAFDDFLLQSRPRICEELSMLK